MHSILIILQIFNIFVLNEAVSGFIECDLELFCPTDTRPYGNPQTYYSRLREEAKKIAELSNMGVIGVAKSSSYKDLIHVQASLCLDDTIGFILDRDVSNYTVSCVWTGLNQRGRCQPVPSKYSNETFTYLDEFTWTKKLKNVRQKLGCSSIRSLIDALDYFNSTNRSYAVLYEASELFICNERCVQGGIGYLQSMLIMLALIVSLFKGCVAQ